VGTIVPSDRGRRGLTYTLLTPANRYMSRRPDLTGAAYYKLVTPRLAPSRFGQDLIVAGDDAVTAGCAPGYERFMIGMSGDSAIRHGDERIALGDGGYAYLGQAQFFVLELAPGASVIAIKRRYDPWQGLAEPEPVFGRLSEVEATPTAVLGLNRRELLDPSDPAFDFNISHMEFGPGVALPQIEIHDEEHGLYMTSGGGLYHLDGDEHEVGADDFIYMAPYCPQGFRAGPEGGSYLLYKDTWRDGF
jgi:(S)-ureidoglycine aminohydrolase